MIIHTVASGDTIFSISKQYSVPESRIITDNYLNPTKKLFVGQSLVISKPSKTCVVRGGDTLSSIAERNGISVMTLMQNNPTTVTKKLMPSQPLSVEYDKNELKSIIVSAYSGNAAENEIEKWMPYISILNIQNASVLENGEMVILKSAEPLITLSKRYNALPVLTFDWTDERGVWRCDYLNSILESPISTEKFIQSALKAVKGNGLAGLEMQICCEDDPYKYRLWDMLLALGGLLKENGYSLLIPFLPGITSDDSAAELNDIADLIPIKNYIWDDDNTASPAAPADKIAESLSSNALSPSFDKSLLGIPTFGVMYSPAAKGYRKMIVDASFCQNAESPYPISAKFNEATGTPFIVYDERIYESEPRKMLHYEDANSYDKKLDLISKFGLAGVNVMSLEFSSPVLWQVLNQKFNIIKY